MTFLSANFLKLFEGAWAAAAVRRHHGADHSDVAARHRHPRAQDAAHRSAARRRCSTSLEKKPPHIVPGTAVFLTSDPDFAPTALLHNLKHNKVLHEHNVILTIVTDDTPARQRGRAGEDQIAVAALQRRDAASSATWNRRTCPRRWRSPASTAGSSTSCRRRSSCPGVRCRPAAHSGMPLWQDHLFIALAKIGQRRHRLLPDPDRPGGGGRHAGDGVRFIR